MRVRKIVILFMVIVLSLSNAAAADNMTQTGTPKGSILATDITAKINGSIIPAYNIDGNMVVYTKDLKSYGFNVVWDTEKRTVIVTRNNYIHLTPLAAETKYKKAVGTKLGDVLHTDIKTYLNDTEVQSFNINGNTAIYFKDLKSFGEITWDSVNRVISLTRIGKKTTELTPEKIAEIQSYPYPGMGADIGFNDIDEKEPDFHQKAYSLFLKFVIPDSNEKLFSCEKLTYFAYGNTTIRFIYQIKHDDGTIAEQIREVAFSYSSELGSGKLPEWHTEYDIPLSDTVVYE